MEIEPQMEFETPPPDKEDEDSPMKSNLPTFKEFPAPPRLDSLILGDEKETSEDVASIVEGNVTSAEKTSELLIDDLSPPPITSTSDSLADSCETIELR